MIVHTSRVHGLEKVCYYIAGLLKMVRFLENLGKVIFKTSSVPTPPSLPLKVILAKRCHSTGA